MSPMSAQNAVPTGSTGVRTDMQDTTKTVAEQWKVFKNACLPKEAPAIQVTEMRRAFFAGFTSCFGTMKVDIADMPEDEGIKRLERYEKELISFGESVKEGGA